MILLDRSNFVDEKLILSKIKKRKSRLIPAYNKLKNKLWENIL